MPAKHHGTTRLDLFIFGLTMLDTCHKSLKNNMLSPLPRKFSGFWIALLLASAPCYSNDDAGIELPTLGAPTGVAVSASNRRITAAWNAVPGATSYAIAVRLKNGLALAWREYPTPSSPYTIADMYAMSGMPYEVRVAAVNAHGHSEWSRIVSITAPELQAAPADAITSSQPPYFVGEAIFVSLASQHPFANRSPWHWSICNADGSGCKVLPQSLPTYVYLMQGDMQGKRVSVQVDYDKEGVSYSATAVLGVVAARAAGAEALAADTVLTTHLYALQSASVSLRWERLRSGAIAPLSNDLLVATPWGRIALVRPNGEVAYLEGRVPMNVAEYLAYPDKANFRLPLFCVTDILLKQHSAGRYELFVTHHYFTGTCIRFRLSSTTLLQQGASVSVSSAWRTIFDAEPCLPIDSSDLNQAAGRMLTDGPDHLLVVIGHYHSSGKFAQASDSHLGKLVRIEIETGTAETLAVGLRNPQGFARDEDGTLWETEHGPQGGDELNGLEAGGNYGWPLVSYGVEYGGKVNVPRAEEVGRHEGFAKPVFAWVPSIGISSIVVNDERLFPLWGDDLLIGSLRSHSLFRVRRDGADVQYVERIHLGYRIRDLAQMPDSRIALLADGGRVHFLSRSYYAYCDGESKKERRVYAIDCGSGIDPTDAVGAVAASGAQLYGAHCSGCHSLSAEEHGLGPHLVGVLGRRIGSVSGYLFSDALKSLDMAWTPTRLERFLTNPKQFAPGTFKASLSITPAEARAIADFIRGD